MCARVLVIDDDPVNVRLIGYLLRAFGHEAVLALGGEPAIDEATKRAPDLVLCDIQMPGFDGFEVLKQLRSDERFAATAIVCVTALAMVGDQEKIMAAGFDGYLTKPITPETFIDDIEKYLPAALVPPRVSRPADVAEEVPPLRPKGSGYALVVDVHAPGRELLRHLIDSLGVGVRTASNADDAMAFTRDHGPPRLIISDRLALLEMAQADAILKDVPFVLLLDDEPTAEEERRGRSAGVDGFLERPLDPEIMLDLLASWIPLESFR